MGSFIYYKNSNKNLVLLFDQNKSDVTEEHQAALLRVYNHITYTKKRYIDSVIVRGHSSKEGDVLKNLNLSEQRALNIKREIQTIDSGLLVRSYFYGSNQPYSDSKDQSKNYLDRRAEVIFYYRNK